MPKVLKITGMQYLKKVVSDEIDFLHPDKQQNFLHADKNRNFLQVDTTFFSWLYVWSGMSKVPRKVYNLCDISRMKLGIKLIFCMQGYLIILILGVRRSPSHESDPLHKYESKIIANDYFLLEKRKCRDQGPVIMFCCSEIF